MVRPTLYFDSVFRTRYVPYFLVSIIIICVEQAHTYSNAVDKTVPTFETPGRFFNPLAPIRSSVYAPTSTYASLHGKTNHELQSRHGHATKERESKKLGQPSRLKDHHLSGDGHLHNYKTEYTTNFGGVNKGLHNTHNRLTLQTIRPHAGHHHKQENFIVPYSDHNEEFQTSGNLTLNSRDHRYSRYDPAIGKTHEKVPAQTDRSTEAPGTAVYTEDGHVRQPRSRGVHPTMISLFTPENKLSTLGRIAVVEDEPGDPNDEFRNSPINPAVAVSGGAAVLPCNITSDIQGDNIQLVLWYRDFVPTPIYSYDVRLGLYSRPKEWADPSILGKRAHFSATTLPAALVLNATTKADEGVYRCRVDFRQHITTHARVNLTIIEPVSRVIIQDTDGKELVSVAGPYSVNSTPSLVCKVFGGDPTPTATWWKNGNVLDTSNMLIKTNIEQQHGGRRPSVVESTLQLDPLTRGDLRATYTCRASNHERATVQEASVEIDMNFGPDNVTVRGLGRALSTNQRHQVMCEAKGSRPPAILTWYLDENIVKSVSHVTSLDGQVSSSTLELVLQPEDQDSILTCRAENPELPGAALEQSHALQVLYPPRVSVVAGASLDLESIKEGDDVYFDCVINARPPASKITWLIGDKELEQNVSGGVMAVGQSLVLQKVSRRQAGNYSCTAINSQGQNTSSPIQLSVKYSPVCRVEQSDVYGVGRLERTTVTCRVQADPPASSYRWAFNNTGEFVDIPQSHYTIKTEDSLGQRSDLRYSPVSDLDYGTLLCWATNTVGTQRVPCTFTVFPAGKPDAVASCRALNQTEESVAVVCEAGYSGGVNQSFVLQAWDDGALRATDRSDTPTLEVRGLRPGTRYSLRVYAENSMGRSHAFSFNAFTLTDVAERRTAIGKGTEGQAFSPLIGSLVGASISIAILLIVGLLVARCKRHDGHQNHSLHSDATAEDTRYKSCSDSETDGPVGQTITGDTTRTAGGGDRGACSPKATTTLTDETQINPTCDLVSTSQDSMSRSQDSNAPLLGSQRLGPPDLKSDLSYLRRDSINKQQQKIPLINSEGSPNSGPSPTSPITGMRLSPANPPPYSYRQTINKQKPSESKWPPETDWGMVGDPFLFSTFADIDTIRSHMSESGAVKASHSLVSPLSSPGSVDPRRHSAYLRPLDDVLVQGSPSAETQDERHMIPSMLQKTSSNYSQHSLPRQYLSSSKSGSHLHSTNIQVGMPAKAASPLGFSSTLQQQPRHYAGHGFMTGGGQRVTKPSSQSTKCPSDHESSV